MPYRVEVASQGRAVCKNKECKDAAVKIAKGEFRMGTLITIHEHTSWTWKHWGCVTPLQIGHLQDDTDGDTDMVDGYDELPSELQEKVKYALQNGHVPDEDWKGDVECNRPGAKGFRVKKSAAKTKKGKKGAKDNEGSADEVDAPKPKKKRGRPVKEEDDHDDEEQEAPPPKKARGRPKKTALKEEQAESDAEESKVKKTARGKKSFAKKEEASDAQDSEEVEAEVEEEKPQRGRKKSGAAATTTPNSKKPASARKGGRKRKASSDED